MHTEAHTTQDAVNNARNYDLLDGLPSRVTYYATPLSFDEVMKANVGLFAQDQWSLKRWSINAGVRFDSFNAYVPEQSLEPGPHVPGRSVPFAQGRRRAQLEERLAAARALVRRSSATAAPRSR